MEKRADSHEITSLLVAAFALCRIDFWNGTSLIDNCSESQSSNRSLVRWMTGTVFIYN